MKLEKSVIPDSYFCNEAAFRSGGNNIESALSTAGTLLKPLSRHDLKDFVENLYVIIYVLRGEGTYIDWNGKSHHMYPGAIVQRIPGKIHSTIHARQGEIWCEMYLGMSKDFFNTLVSTQSVNPEVPVFDIGLHFTVAEQFKNIITTLNASRKNDADCLLAAHQLILDIRRREQAMRLPSKHGDIIENARNLLDNPDSCDHDLAKLAQSLNLGYERFRKLFREEVGLSPGAYRIRRRIESACRLLVEQQLSIKEIADRLHYPDIHSFSKQFTQIQGQPPSEFRKKSFFTNSTPPKDGIAEQ